MRWAQLRERYFKSSSYSNHLDPRGRASAAGRPMRSSGRTRPYPSFRHQAHTGHALASVIPLSKTNRSSRSAKLLAGCMIGAARVPMRFSAPVNRNYPGVRLLGAYGLADGISNVIAFVRVASQRALLIEGLIGLDCRHPNIRVACHYYPRFALPHRISGRSLQASLRLSRAFVFERAHQ